MLLDKRQIAWEAALTAIVTLILAYSWMFSSISVPNERSRIYLAVAMVDHGTVQIDAPMKRFGKIYDLAKKDGHFYSDKAPGSSLIAAAVYKAVRLFSQPEDWPIERLINLMRSWVMIPIGVFGFLLIRRVLRFLDVDPPAIDIASLGWILGTSAFHYSTAFFGHQIVGVAFLGALAAILTAENRLAREGRGAPALPVLLALTGILCGIAGLTEYQAGIPCLFFALYVFASFRRHPRALAAFVAGAAICVGILGLYNHAAFGSPLELSYHHLADKKLAELHTQGVGGVTMPTWEYFSGSMFSLHRGLFTTSPIFILAPFGLFHLLQRRRRVAGLFGATALFYILFISSSNVWFAGWGFGPRLVVPGMGVLAIMAAVAIDRALALWPVHGFARGMALAGIFYHQAIHAFFPEAPDSTKNPLVDIVIPMWKADLVSPNLAEKFTDLRGVESLAPLALLLTVVTVIMITRGLRDTAGGWPKRGLGIITAVLVAVGHLAFISQAAGTWNSGKRKKFENAIERWTRHEDNMRKQALDAASKIKNMEK